MKEKEIKQKFYTEPMKQLISKNKYEELHKYLHRLSWKQKVAIQLRYWEECTIYQVALHLGISWKEADELIESALKTLKIGLTKSISHSSMPSAA